MLLCRPSEAPHIISLLGCRLDLQRSVLHVGPFAHGAIVVLSVVVSHQLHDEHTVRRSDATLSIRVNVLVRRDAILRQDAPYVSGGLELVRVPVHQVEPFQMHRSRYVADSLVAPASAAVPLSVAPHVPDNRAVQITGGFEFVDLD